MVTKEKLDKAMKALLETGPVEHKRPKKPTKKELETKYKLVVYSDHSKPKIKKVEDE